MSKTTTGVDYEVELLQRIAALEAEIESDNKTIELLKAENEALRKDAPKWIDITEQAPLNGQAVVLLYQTGNVWAGTWIGGANCTHWFPLPDAAMKDSP